MAMALRVVTSIVLFSLLLPGTKSVLMKSSECSGSLGCIINPEGTMMLTWRPTSQHIHFTLRGYLGSSDVYVAMGLSHDERMGNDDVIECVHTGGAVRIYCSYNLGRSNTRYADGGLLNTSGIFDSGTMECSYTRSLRGYNITGGYKHDLERPWHVLLVWGHLQPGTNRKQIHNYVSVSFNKVSLRAVGSFQTQKLSDVFIHLHGCLMIISWVTLTSIGIIFARHFKGLLPETEVCGKQVWFQVHRSLMVLVVVLTVAGFIVIFVEVGGYQQADSIKDIFPYFHPILGIIVTALCILNPILAWFRPAPKSPRRPIFNWVHRCIGTGSHILGAVTLFFGMKLKKANASPSMLLVLGAFAAWHVIMEILFSCIVYVKKRNASDSRRDSARAYTVEKDEEDKPKHPKVSGYQELLLMLHCAVTIATTIFLLALFLSTQNH